MKVTIKRDRIRISGLYLACCILVVSYVNMYGLFAHLNKLLGSSFIATSPLIIPPLTILFVILYGIFVRSRSKTVQFQWPLLGAGFILIGVALALPDPAYPVKRIHVTQYALLSALVRYTMSYRLSGSSLLIFSIVFGSVLGIHEEFLQGIHPKRTYGLRDMAVNILSVAGSGFVYHGLGIFIRKNDGSERSDIVRFADISRLIILMLALCALVIPVASYLGQPIPFWPFLPLAALLVYWTSFVYFYEAEESCSRGHGAKVISMMIFLFLLYPIVLNALQIPFL